jgi:hypothetical protein
MQRPRPVSEVPVALLVALLGATLLSACGGGGSDPASSDTAIDDATATAYAADATQVGSSTADAIDTAVLAAQATLGADMVAPAGASRATALADVGPLATAPGDYACPGGGSATITVTGATVAGLGNGQFDAGETYAIAFSGCAGAAGAATVDGALALSVDAASGDSHNGTLGLTMTATGLTVALPHGAIGLSGSVSRQVTVTTDADGTVHLSSQLTSPGLELTTAFNARASSFTLSAVDLSRTAVLSGGLLQSSTLAGTHTLTATLPNGAFSYTVATQGATTYGADGLPTSGSWAITLPYNLIDVNVSNGSATVSIDHGKDGSIDRTFTLPIGQFAGSAG